MQVDKCGDVIDGFLYRHTLKKLNSDIHFSPVPDKPSSASMLRTATVHDRFSNWCFIELFTQKGLIYKARLTKKRSPIENATFRQMALPSPHILSRKEGKKNQTPRNVQCKSKERVTGRLFTFSKSKFWAEQSDYKNVQL